MGLQVPAEEQAEFTQALDAVGYQYEDVSENKARPWPPPGRRRASEVFAPSHGGWPQGPGTSLRRSHTAPSQAFQYILGR